MFGQTSPMYTTPAPDPEFGLPGTTASGIASASQLVQSTPCVALRAGMTAAPGRLLVLFPGRPAQQLHEIVGPTPLIAGAYPVLAGIWDNDDDAIFDTV
jgi:hypothetical protein